MQDHKQTLRRVCRKSFSIYLSRLGSLLDIRSFSGRGNDSSGSLTTGRLPSPLYPFLPMALRNASPYRSALVSPTPLTCSSSSLVDGLRATISFKVLSWKTTKAGIPFCSAISIRTARNFSQRALSSTPEIAISDRELFADLFDGHVGPRVFPEKHFLLAFEDRPAFGGQLKPGDLGHVDGQKTGGH